jgi:site-specific DNA-methyltransferase (adenine-specific)
MMQPLVQMAMADAGFEIRSAIMRLYYGFRGGDRPKNAEKEFPEVCVTAKGAYEPWMLFRKPISERTVAENLRKWKTGGLRRLSEYKPLPDVIASGRTPAREEAISDHPCLKPQHFMRIIVRALLPMGEGVVLDPFMGAGSTLAAARAVGYDALGVEIDEHYFQSAERAIPKLSSLYRDFDGSALRMETEYATSPQPDDVTQLTFTLAEEPRHYGVSTKKRGRATGKTKSSKSSISH